MAGAMGAANLALVVILPASLPAQSLEQRVAAVGTGTGPEADRGNPPLGNPFPHPTV
jgi:hypothetical protein